MLAYIFSAQGWGSLVGCIVTMVVLAAYKQTMDVHGHVHKVDGGTLYIFICTLFLGPISYLCSPCTVWRIIVGISLVPAFATLYHRLTLPEAKKFTDAQKQGSEEIDPAEWKKNTDTDAETSTSDSKQEKSPAVSDKKAHWAGMSPFFSKFRSLMDIVFFFSAFFHYFKQWRHARVLLATAGCWFLVDIAFYGVNLNSSVLLTRIGFQGKTGTAWHKLYRLAIGNLIITGLGFFPGMISGLCRLQNRGTNPASIVGYYATVLTVEYLGRKWIQIQGFLMTALFRTSFFKDTSA